MLTRMFVGALLVGSIALSPAVSFAKATKAGAVWMAQTAVGQMKNSVREGRSDGMFSLAYGGFRSRKAANDAARAVRKLNLGLSVYVTAKDQDGYSIVFNR